MRARRIVHPREAIASFRQNRPSVAAVNGVFSAGCVLYQNEWAGVVAWDEACRKYCYNFGASWKAFKEDPSMVVVALKHESGKWTAVGIPTLEGPVAIRDAIRRCETIDSLFYA